MDDIPKLPNPEKVTDLVMLLGMNNIKHADRSIMNTPKTADTTCRKYQAAFPNATIHLGSVAPINEKCIAYNSYLHEMAEEREVPFISTEGMFDEQSGRPKEKMFRDIHYTKQGICPLARNIKRSL